MLVLFSQLLEGRLPSRSRACRFQKYANSIVREEVVSSIQVSSLLVAVVILDCLPVSAAWQDSSSELWTFETAAFEDYCASIAVSTVAYVPEALHVAFEVEKEL